MADRFPILVAEDSPVDAELLSLAMHRVGIQGPVCFVTDGQAAIEYLEGRGLYADRRQFPFPKVILTDLKMPRLNGLELLQWLSDHPQCCVIPTILLSGSALDAEIVNAYRLGANTYFEKPTGFEELIELMRDLKNYWAKSQLPTLEERSSC